MQIDIEFHERKDGTQMVAVKVGNSMVAMESSEWLVFAHGVIREISAHLTQRALDAACACGSPAFYTDKVLGVVCCRCQAPRQ